MKRLLILLTLFFVQKYNVQSQNYFNKALPSDQNNIDGIIHPLIELENDTLVVFTTTVYLKNYGGTGSISLLDNKGNILNTSKFLDSINTAIVVNSKKIGTDLYLSGSKFIYNDTSEIFWYAKLNSSLDTIWTKEIKTGYNRSSFRNIYKLKNSNLALCGTDILARPSGSAIKTKAILLLTDSLGNKLSYLESFDTNNYEGFYNFTEDENGNIYVCGIVAKDNLNHDALIVKFSSEGKLVWKKQIPSPDYLEGLSNIYSQRDGSLLCIGNSNNPGFPSFFSYILLINIDPDGNVNWTKRIMKLYDGEIRYCVEEFSGNYICAGTIIAGQNKKGDGYLNKFSAQGDSIWSRTINNSDISTEQFYNITQASDGGFYLTGYSWIKDSTSTINTSKAWIVKVDSFGCLVPGCQNVVKTKDVDEGKVKAFEFYPNPVKDVLYFLSRVTKNDDYTILICDMQGKEVYNYKFLPVQGKQYIMEFENNILPGVYMLRIHDRKGRIIQTDNIEKL